MSRPNKRPHTRSAGIILYYSPKFNTEMGKISDFQAFHAIPSPLLQPPEMWKTVRATGRERLPDHALIKSWCDYTGGSADVCAMPMARGYHAPAICLRLRAALIAPVIAPEPVRGNSTPFHGRESFAPRAVQAMRPIISTARSSCPAALKMWAGPGMAASISTILLSWRS